MLHTVLVISAYMSMVFIPCACAQWGEVLTAEWRILRRDLRADLRRRRAGMSEALITAIREARVAARIEAFAAEAFAEIPVAFPRFAAFAGKVSRGRPRRRALVFDPAAFTRAMALVRIRLMALSEPFRLAQLAFDGPVFDSPMMAFGTPLVPMRFALERPAPLAPQMPLAVPTPLGLPRPIAARLNDNLHISFEDNSLEARLQRRLQEQVARTAQDGVRKPPTRALPAQLTPAQMAGAATPETVAKMQTVLHFPPSAAELEALYALDAQPAGATDANSGEGPVSVAA
jgi:hypothetical protein